MSSAFILMSSAFKDSLRDTLKALCADAMPAFNASHARALASATHRLITDMPDVRCVAIYMPMADEVDTQPLIDLLQGDYALALPVVSRLQDALCFRVYHHGDDLQRDLAGIESPLETQPLAVPDVIVLPMLGFTEKGYRLGRGGGYYDRTLAVLPNIATIGLAASFQKTDFRAQPHDRPLQSIVTEMGVIEACTIPDTLS